MSYLEKLIGKRILDIKFLKETYFPINESKEAKNESTTVDSVWINLGDFKITIINPIRFKNVLSDINSFLNKKINNVSESDIEAILTVEDGQKLIIDLRSESYIGPEALILHGPNKLTVVWN